MNPKHTNWAGKRLPVKALLMSAAFAAFAAFSAGAEEDGDYAFLVRHMPTKDRGVVSEAYLRANVKLAQEARRTAPQSEGDFGF